MKVLIKNTYVIFPEVEEEYKPLFPGDVKLKEEINYFPEIVECNGIDKLKEILLNTKIGLTELSVRRIIAIVIDNLPKEKQNVDSIQK